MNIKVLDSWLKEYLKTKAKAPETGRMLSLTSVSVDRIEKHGNDFIYDIEVTTNRPDLMSVIGLAREAASVLPQFGIEAVYLPLHVKEIKEKSKENLSIEIKNDPALVNRICAVIMEVTIKDSPQLIKERLETSGIRSLNNLIDVTNYVMRETGHPTHVFDYDRLTTKKMIIRASKKGEKVVTLDGKTHILQGEDIIADNGEGEIVDLLGVMGTANSVVTDQTKRILFFIDNNEPRHIRKTSMSLGIRTEAAVINEKGLDSNLSMEALLRGIELFKEIASGKLLSEIIDIYPNKPKVKHVTIFQKKVNEIIGIEIPVKKSVEILTKLGFGIKIKGDTLDITVPSWRNDIEIPEDIVEEIARVYGYHKLPSVIPPLTSAEPYHISKNPFYWEMKTKEALKYWGFTETYTYSMVSEELLEGPTESALKLANPLNEDIVYMRKTLVPSLLKVVRENEGHEKIKIFELSNVYLPNPHNLPNEILKLAGVIKDEKVSFYEVKGIIEQLLNDLGIKNLRFKTRINGGEGASIYTNDELLGEIEILDENIADFEMDFEILRKHFSLSKIYKPVPKFPPTIEDVRLEIGPDITYWEIVSFIKEQSDLIKNVELIDIYENKKTFRIKYQNSQKTLTTEEVTKVREKLFAALEKQFNAKVA